MIALKDQLLPSVSAASEASAKPLAQMALGLQQGVKKGLQGIPHQLRTVSVQQGIKNLQDLPGMQGVHGTLGRVKVIFIIWTPGHSPPQDLTEQQVQKMQVIFGPKLKCPFEILQALTKQQVQKVQVGQKGNCSV